MICYLAKGDVALSITLTLCSTLLAVVAMPTLTWWYLGERIPVPVWGMLFTVLKIVIAPVCIGVLINHLAGPRLHHIKPIFPVISVIAIVKRYITTAWRRSAWLSWRPSCCIT